MRMTSSPLGGQAPCGRLPGLMERFLTDWLRPHFWGRQNLRLNEVFSLVGNSA